MKFIEDCFYSPEENVERKKKETQKAGIISLFPYEPVPMHL
jgi:hypothetical protein